MMRRLLLLVGAPLLISAAVASQAPAPDVTSLGPRVGAIAPPVSGVDQFGRTQTLQSLMQRDGLMLVFFRSADW